MTVHWSDLRSATTPGEWWRRRTLQEAIAAIICARGAEPERAIDDALSFVALLLVCGDGGALQIHDHEFAKFSTFLCEHDDEIGVALAEALAGLEGESARN